MFLKKFGMLRKILRAIGLKEEATTDVVNFVSDLLENEEEVIPAKPETLKFPYRLRDDFLSPAEFTFFKVLSDVVGDKAYICTKVKLSDIFWVQSSDNSEFRTYTNKIDRKHLDYLLCHPATMKPLLGIELDDKSHKRENRQERDAFVDEVFKAAGLTLIHIPVRQGYQLTELTALLAPYLEEDSLSLLLPKVVEPSLTQDNTCPKCGGEMVLRTAKKGKNAGQQFWGCSNYPQCRTMLAFEKVD